jgi:hypothetical protein
MFKGSSARPTALRACAPTLEAGCRIHHAKDPGRGGDSVEIAELALQAAEYGHAGQSCSLICLPLRDLETDFAQGHGQ